MLVAVCGLKDERRILAKSNALVLCGAAAVAQLDSQVPANCTGILSFGICGALSPDLRVGDLVLGATVMDGKEVHPADGEWLVRLKAGLKRLLVEVVPVWSVGAEGGVTPAERAALFGTTRCWIIDDESSAVASFAKRRGVPFAVMRAVSDDARTALPPAARRVVCPDGGLRIDVIWRALRTDPSQILGLERTAFNFSRAIGRLWDAYRTVGPRFCFRPHEQ
jgi:adenosylhomocysteine nucleosidase